LRRLSADLTLLNGRPRAERSTRRRQFLHDVLTAPIGNLARNRMIDHAAAIVRAPCASSASRRSKLNGDPGHRARQQRQCKTG